MKLICVFILMIGASTVMGSNFTCDKVEIAKKDSRIAELEEQLKGFQNNCPSGWISHCSSCYRIIRSPSKSWRDAKNHCEDLQSTLVVIESESENEFLRQQLRKISVFEYQAWIGLSDTAQEGTWKWVNSNAFTAWAAGEPNGGRRENCAAMYEKFDYKWNDSLCGEKYGYICEMKMVC